MNTSIPKKGVTNMTRNVLMPGMPSHVLHNWRFPSQKALYSSGLKSFISSVCVGCVRELASAKLLAMATDEMLSAQLMKAAKTGNTKEAKKLLHKGALFTKDEVCA